MKSARQVRDLIKNISKKKGIDPLILLKNYMMERLLEKVATHSRGFSRELVRSDSRR